jgi:hypothetical protein
MKLVAALVVGLVVLEVERKSHRAVELELAALSVHVNAHPVSIPGRWRPMIGKKPVS